MSNLLGCYWNYATNVRNVKWAHTLDSDSCIDAMYDILKKYKCEIIGPTYGNQRTIYRTVFGISLRPLDDIITFNKVNADCLKGLCK